MLATYTRGLGAGGGIGGLLARTDSSGSAYYHSDAGGNITALVDSSGNLLARYLYDPYGNLLSKSGSLADANTYRFSSKEIHANSGMYYYGFRFYEPNLQRWLNQDPMGVAGGINLYGFVGNNPIGFVDAYGLDWTQWPVVQWWERVTRPLIGWGPNGPPQEPKDTRPKPSWVPTGPENDNMGLQSSFLGEMLLPGGGFFMSGGGASACAARTMAEAAARRKAAELAAEASAKLAAEQAKILAVQRRQILILQREQALNRLKLVEEPFDQYMKRVKKTEADWIKTDKNYGLASERTMQAFDRYSEALAEAAPFIQGRHEEIANFKMVNNALINCGK